MKPLPARAILIWLFVILPLAWGVTQSVRKAAPLFRGDRTPTVEPR